ncbi:MAG: sigma-70 family RNA polymerase sigma factor [Prevotella sp.]|nr:sigma-70 family RNA polymerase sigma factor [Prevotella sp.]
MTDKQTFERIFRTHYHGMFCLARRMLRDEALSKDVASDVFAQLLHSKADLKAETLQAFLMTNVRHRCINLLIHRQKETTAITGLKASMAVSDDDQQTIAQEQYEALHHFIDEKLPPLSQQVIRLRYERGLKYREIAQVLNISEVSVYNHLSKSLWQMKEYFKTQKI